MKEKGRVKCVYEKKKVSGKECVCKKGKKSICEKKSEFDNVCVLLFVCVCGCVCELK